MNDVRNFSKVSPPASVEMGKVVVENGLAKTHPNIPPTNTAPSIGVIISIPLLVLGLLSPNTYPDRSWSVPS